MNANPKSPSEQAAASPPAEPPGTPIESEPPQRVIISGKIEIAALLVSPLVLMLVARWFRAWAPFGVGADWFGPEFGTPNFWPAHRDWELMAVYWILAVPLLLMARHPRASKPGMVLGIWMMMCAAILAALLRKEMPSLLREIADSPPGIAPDPWILVPILLTPWRGLARWVLPFFAASVLAGERMRPATFAGVYFLFSLLIGGLYEWSLPVSPGPWIGAAALTAVGCLPVWLRGQRAGMEWLMSRPGGLLHRLVLMAWILVLVGLAVMGIVVGAVERRVGRVLAEGAPQSHRSPALVNAYDDVKVSFGGGFREYDEDKRLPDLLESIPSPFDFHVLSPIFSPDLGATAIRKARPEKLTAYFEHFREPIAAIERARGADYLSFPKGDKPNFSAFRSVSRAMLFRAVVRLSEGRHEEAAHDIDNMYRFGTAQMAEGSLLQLMVGSAQVRYTNRAAFEYWLWNRNNPANLEMMIQSMERIAPRLRRSLDFEMLRRSEFGWWPVTIYPNLTVPRVDDVLKLYYQRWLEFDLVLTAMKLDLCRASRGAYPETLEELVPEYLERVPVDPLDGKALIYSNLGDDFDLNSPSYAVPETEPKLESMKLRFPGSEVDTPEARKAVEDWTPPAK